MEYAGFAPKVQKAASAALSGGLAWPNGPESPRLTRSLSDELNKMLAGQQSIERTLNQAQLQWVQTPQG